MGDGFKYEDVNFLGDFLDNGGGLQKGSHRFFGGDLQVCVFKFARKKMAEIDRVDLELLMIEYVGMGNFNYGTSWTITM